MATAPHTHFTSPLLEDRLGKVTRAFILWSRGLFKDAPTGAFRWDENVDETELFVAGSEPEEGAPGSNLPRIVVQRQTAQFMGLSTGQTERPRWGGNTPEVFSAGMSVPVIIRVSAKEGLEAQRIAFTLSVMLLPFRDCIMKVGELHHINTGKVQVSPETPKGSGPIRNSPNPEFKTITIVIPTAIQIRLRVNDLAFYPEVTNFMLSQTTG